MHIGLKIFGVTNFRTVPYFVQINFRTSLCPKVCHTENFSSQCSQTRFPLKFAKLSAFRRCLESPPNLIVLRTSESTLKPIKPWVAGNEVIVKNVNANIPVSLSWLLRPFLAFLSFPGSAQFIASSLAFAEKLN